MKPPTGYSDLQFAEILRANGYEEIVTEAAICDEHPLDPVVATVMYRGDYYCSPCANIWVGALPALAAARDHALMHRTGLLRVVA